MPFISIIRPKGEKEVIHKINKFEQDGQRLSFVDDNVVVPWNELPLPSFSAVLQRGNVETKFNNTLQDWRTRNEQQARAAREKKEAEEKAARELQEAAERAERERKEALEREERLRVHRLKAALLREQNQGFWNGVPLELKVQIVDRVLKAFRPTGQGPTGQAFDIPEGIIELRNKRVLCNLFRICSDLRAYAVWRLLQCFTIMICSGQDIDFFRDFLARNHEIYQKTLNKKELHEHVRSLSFPFFDCYRPTAEQPLSGDLRLALGCPNLNYLAIRWHADKLNKWDHDLGQYSNISRDDIISRYNLHKLLKLKDLKILYLNAHTNDRWYDPGAIMSLWQVKLWLEKQFAEQLEKRQRTYKVTVMVQAVGGMWGYVWQRVEMGKIVDDETDQVVDRLQSAGAFEPPTPKSIIPCAGYRYSAEGL